MKIINKTAWPTSQLRPITQRVAASDLDIAHRKQLIVTFEYRGRNRCLGRGTLGHSPRQPASRVWVYLERPEFIRRAGKGWCGRGGCGTPYRAHHLVVDHAFEVIPTAIELSGPQIAAVLAHEFQHNLGRGHRQMHPKYLGDDYTPWSWASNVTLPKKKVPSGSEVAEKKLAHAEKMLRQAQTRSKRAATILKKWQRRVRTMERRAAALRLQEPIDETMVISSLPDTDLTLIADDMMHPTAAEKEEERNGSKA